MIIEREGGDGWRVSPHPLPFWLDTNEHFEEAIRDLIANKWDFSVDWDGHHPRITTTSVDTGAPLRITFEMEDAIGGIP